MTHEAIQFITPNKEGDTVPPRFVGPLTERASQEASVSAEEKHFLGVLATDLVISIGAAPNTSLKILVANNFMDNVRRLTPDMTEDDRQSLALHLVETAEVRVKTETTTLSAPYVKIPTPVAIDTAEFTDEIIVPSTAELNARIEHLTDETVSPPRGTTLLGANVVGRFFTGPLKRGLEYLHHLPLANENESEAQKELQASR